LKVGDKVWFRGEKQGYTVKAANGVFAICTKPFNPKRTVLYTIVSYLENARGPENLVFGMGAETKEECEEMLERLVRGESEVSHRHRVELDIDRLSHPQKKGKK